MISVSSQTTVSPAVSPATKPVRSTDEKSGAETDPKTNSEHTPAAEKEQETQATKLDPAEEKKLRELKARDREVRAHEQAHLSAAGGHAKGGASYTYERGPDERMYAVGGEVQVDTSVVANDPVATLRKAQIIRQAALAPVNPSSQDRQVAAQATQMENEARAEIAAEKSDSGSPPSTASSTTDTGPSKENSIEAAATCAACGGAHSSGAHDGITAYTAMQPSHGSETVSHS